MAVLLSIDTYTITGHETNSILGTSVDMWLNKKPSGSMHLFDFNSHICGRRITEKKCDYLFHPSAKCRSLE